MMASSLREIRTSVRICMYIQEGGPDLNIQSVSNVINIQQDHMSVSAPYLLYVSSSLDLCDLTPITISRKENCAGPRARTLPSVPNRLSRNSPRKVAEESIIGTVGYRALNRNRYGKYSGRRNTWYVLFCGEINIKSVPKVIDKVKRCAVCQVVPES